MNQFRMVSENQYFLVSLQINFLFLYCFASQKRYGERNKTVLIINTYYLQVENMRNFDVNGETTTFTLLLIKM